MATVDELILKIKVENDGGSSFKDMLSDVKNLGAAGASAFTGMASAATSFAASMAKEVTSSVVSFGKDAVVKLADFRAEMAGVGKTTGITGEELDKLGKTLRNMALDDLRGNVAAEELAQIAAAAGQLGIRGPDIESFTKSVAEISVATDIAADETATSMAQIANQFRTSLEKPRIYFDEFGNSIGTASKTAYQQIGNLGSAINEMSNTTNANASQLIDMTNRMGGLGVTAGVTASDVIALGATMIDAGIGVEKGSTAMNKMVNELVKNSDAFAATLKINSKDLADALSKDPMKAIEMVLKGMDDMGKNEGSKAMLLAVEQLLGKGDGITALATKLSAKYADLSVNASKSADAFMKGTSAHDEFIAQTGHTEARWAALGEKMNEFSRRVAELFEPITNWVTEALNSVADIVLENFDVIGNYVGGFVESIKTKLMDMFGPSVMAAFEKGDILGAFSGIYEQLSSMFQDSPLAVLWDGAGEGILDAIVTGISESVGNIGKLFQDLLTSVQDWISNFAAMFEGTPLEPFIKEIGDLFNNVIDIIKSLIGVGVELFQAVFSPEIIKGTIGVLVAMLGTVAEGINLAIDGIKQFGTLLGEVFAGDIGIGELFAGIGQGLWDTVTGAITGVLEWIKDAFVGIADFILSPFGEAGDAIVAMFSDNFGAIIDFIKDSFSNVGDLIFGIMEEVWGVLEGIFTAWKDFGASVIAFLSGDIGFGDFLASVAKLIADVTAAIWDGITGVLGKIGTFVVEQLTNVGELMIAPFKTIAENIGGPIKDAILAVWEWIKEKFSGLADLVLGPLATIKDKVSGLLSSVSNTVSGLFTDTEEKVAATTAEVENLTAATNAATAATAELGTEALYQSVYPDLIAALKTTTAETDKLTGSIWETTAAVNKLGVEAIYQSVFPDLADSVAASTESTDALTDSIKQTTDAAYSLSKINPTDGWNSAIKSTVSELANAKRAISETAVLSTSSGSTITTTRRLSEGQVASQVESALASNSSSGSSSKSLVNRNVTIQFNGTNVVDESSKSRFARDVATAIASINAQTVRG